MPPRSQDDIGSLEKARERLYQNATPAQVRPTLSDSSERSLPHAWEVPVPLEQIPHPAKRHVRLATIFFIFAALFFVVSLGAAGYFFYFGGNSVSVDKIAITVLGPTTIAGGDTVPLTLTITNTNPVAVENATIEVDFPTGTRSADDPTRSYPRYTENLGTLASGATVTRSIKAVVFGGEGQALSIPISFSYGTGGSTTSFVKKTAYALAVSSTPLSISVDTLSETVSGKPLTLTLVVRSNATTPIDNVILTSALPFGFTVTESSVPLSGSTFVLGTFDPGVTRTITLTGTLSGQNNEQRVFHFTVGTSKSATDHTPLIAYLTQDATVLITAPFLTTTLSLNGDTSPNTVSPGSHQSVTVSYANTLSTSVTDAVVSIKLSGSAVDYNSIQTSNGFYRSSDHTIVFSKDTDPALSQLAPGASGIGSFSFDVLSSNSLTSLPNITFTTSVSGTRVGQSNVPEDVNATVVKTVKVATAVILTSRALHSSGPFANTGPIPPVPNQPTTYTIQWGVQNKGSTIADGTVRATLPSYIKYEGKTSGNGSFSYDDKSRTISWNIGDLTQNANAGGAFQVSITPSDSQKGDSPKLTGTVTFSGYDRFAGISLSTSVDAPTIETKGDPGYISAYGTVQ